jgi:acyloxyacyl hydrolase
VSRYLSCLGVNPCWGWLNSNATWRNATQARADALNAVYGQIVEQRGGTFANFELLYYEPPLTELITQYLGLTSPPSASPRQAIDCIEPCDGFFFRLLRGQLLAEITLCHCDPSRNVEGGYSWRRGRCDGFHPSQPLQMLYAEAVWQWLERSHPHVLGEINPHNADIERVFGGQGGYWDERDTDRERERERERAAAAAAAAVRKMRRRKMATPCSTI